MREKHSALVNNIGTYDEEDEAYELLNSLSQSLPFIVMITSVFEALLAAVYLKWFHPWKILLQEVSFFNLTSELIVDKRRCRHERQRMKSGFR